MNDIEKLIEYIKDHSNNYLGSKATLKEIETFEYMYDLLIGTLEKQLSGGWIPVSERLPEEYGCYLVAWMPIGLTDKDILKNTGTVPHYYEIVEFDPDDEALWLSSIESCDSYEILAWQPSPEPWKEVEHEKNS